MEKDVLILLGAPRVGLTPIFGLLMKSDIHTSAKFSVCTFPDSKTPLFFGREPLKRRDRAKSEAGRRHVGCIKADLMSLGAETRDAQKRSD